MSASTQYDQSCAHHSRACKLRGKMHETITISPTDLARGEAAALDALTALLDAAQYHAGIAGLLRLVADAKRRNIERRKKLAEENLADFSVPNNAAIARMMREAYYRRDWDAVREIEALADKLGAVQSPDLQDVMAQMYRDQQDDAARS